LYIESTKRDWGMHTQPTRRKGRVYAKQSQGQLHTKPTSGKGGWVHTEPTRRSRSRLYAKPASWERWQLYAEQPPWEGWLYTKSTTG
jgi:hypothetical protein